MKNAGFYFYKTYFDTLRFSSNTGIAQFDGLTATQKLQNWKLEGLQKQLHDEALSNVPVLQLVTTYPGLLIGSGSPHDIGSNQKNEDEHLVKNELRLGLSFDHSSGLPVIPGSSLKGALRNAFKHPGYIQELITAILKEDAQLTIWQNSTQKAACVTALEANIFEGAHTSSLYQRDCFYPAFPTLSKNNKNTFLATDYITHHECVLKSPNPVQFLKILPRVTFQFHFRLFPVTIKIADSFAITFTALQKRQLCQLILIDLGLGAKTNVGYGQFVLDKTGETTATQAKENAVQNAKIEAAQKLVIKIKTDRDNRIKQNKTNREEEENEMKANGLKNVLSDSMDFKSFKTLVDRYKTIGDLNTQTATVHQHLIQLVKTERQNNKKKRDWKKKGKGNWYKVKQWFGGEIADQWFDELQS